MQNPDPQRRIDVVCAGETMAMFVPTELSELTEASQFHLSVGGAESNVAQYLAQLGFTAAWISRLGDDPFGDLILEHMRGAGVHVEGVTVTDDHPTGIAYKQRTAQDTTVHYYRSGSAASHLSHTDASAAWSLSPRLLHLSGITLALSDSCKEFIRAALTERPNGALISFDVNWRPQLWLKGGETIIHEIANSVDICFIGLDEAEALWGHHTPDDVRSALPGPRVLVVKRGAAGCTVFAPDGVHEVPALTVDVVEPVGAGDAFAAGFIAGYLRGESMKRAARLGTVVASNALSVSTDVGTLPEQDTIETLLTLDDDEWNSARYRVSPKPARSLNVANR